MKKRKESHPSALSRELVKRQSKAHDRVMKKILRGPYQGQPTYSPDFIRQFQNRG